MTLAEAFAGIEDTEFETPAERLEFVLNAILKHLFSELYSSLKWVDQQNFGGEAWDKVPRHLIENFLAQALITQLSDSQRTRASLEIYKGLLEQSLVEKPIVI